MASALTDADITVVIPAWNVGDDLTRAAYSALASDMPLELLVVDNASDAPLPHLPGPRIRLEKRVDLGTARNVGLERVRTPFVFFLDADDVILAGTIARLRHAMDDDQRAVVAACAFEGWRPETDYRGTWGFPPRIAYRLQRRQIMLAYANLVKNMVPTVGALLRTQAVRAVGGFGSGQRGEDWSLGAELAFRGKVRLSREPGVLIAVKDSSVSTESEHLGAIWRSRAAVRSRIRNSSIAPWHARAAIPLLIPLHAFTALRRARLRHARFGVSEQ